MYFNPNTKGIEWIHNREWVLKQLKQLKPLMQVVLIKVAKLKTARDKRYTNWHFYHNRYELTQLANGWSYMKYRNKKLI